MPHNHQKKIAVINDYSGFGRCSIAVELPIISAMKVQCCPLPTSIFSNHTGFESFFYRDFTDHMSAYMAEWEKLQLRFNGICTGFLGSVEQIDLVLSFLKRFKNAETKVIVDPVMGDYGKLYPTYTDAICQRMKQMIPYAEILTPNLTEACVLADLPYREDFNEIELKALTAQLAAQGPQKIVITGIPRGNRLLNFCYDHGRFFTIDNEKLGASRSGTGDIFAAIIAADAVNGVDFQTSVEKAVHFIGAAIQKGIEMDIPLTDGVPFEEVLDQLICRQ